MAKGREGLDEGLRVRLAREEPIPEAALAALRAEMSESHCGELPERMLDPLVLAQRARDARMAERLVSAGATRGAVLVTGAGHARTDRGVPALVAKDEPGKKVVAVAFVEVQAGDLDPASYLREAGGPAPYDFLVFTPGAKREDMCAEMRAHVEKKQKEPAKDAASPRGD